MSQPLSEHIKQASLTLKRMQVCREQLQSLATKCHEKAQNLDVEGEEASAAVWDAYMQTIQHIHDQMLEAENNLRDMVNNFRFYL